MQSSFRINSQPLTIYRRPQLGNGVVIIDAGGGTVDISAYRKITTPKGETFEEIARPQCDFVHFLCTSCLLTKSQGLFAGSIWVSNRAREHLRSELHYLTIMLTDIVAIAKLRGSRYAGDVDHIRECFDKTTKLRFRRTNDLQYIKFGRPGDNNEALNITSGQLKLEGCGSP